MDILWLDDTAAPLPDDPVVVVALDGWTDAGRSGSLAAERLLEAWPGRLIGAADPDLLYDYRDRRPLLHIDRGVLGEPEWPGMELTLLEPPGGPAVLLLRGAEPDLSWQQLTSDLAELAEQVGATRSIGLGAVPGPIPHTRQPPIITTSSSEKLLEAMGRPHEQVLVPASCQVVLEAGLRDAGLETLGLWVRIPHYVAGEFPAGAVALLERFSDHLGVAVDLADLRERAEQHRHQLDAAAASSPDVIRHVRQLEVSYDADAAARLGLGRLPSGDEIAAEVQRFLIELGDGGDQEGGPRAPGDGGGSQ